jgi:subtilisin family serine protease
VRRLLVVLALAAAVAPVASAFAPTDPLAPRQWYVQRVRAFDAWPAHPVAAPVRVAVVDTGVDLGHPDLAGRVAAARSFVGGTARDTVGHGTFVAGVIAAAHDNGQGIAGIAFPAELLVAKVVRDDGTILPEDEARAIRWAVDQGADVINLSIGGLRDPSDRRRDTYSELEQRAIEYAHENGVVVVAAVGNGDDAPQTPWRYASYPAALPHVIGVGAISYDGSVPDFSNRDAVYTDLVAPGEGIVSLFPRALTAAQPACREQGYSPCGSGDYRDGEGTSFAVPQVAAAAAVVLSQRPELGPEQVADVLARSAFDLSPATGCLVCAPGRDAASGWGALDIAAAIESLDRLPPIARDSREPNDDAGERAPRLWGPPREVRARLDFWDDQIDVYRVKLTAGQLLSVSLRGAPGLEADLMLWTPGTLQVEGLSLRGVDQRVAQTAGAGAAKRFAHRARATGWYYVEVKATRAGAGTYSLRIART